MKEKADRGNDIRGSVGEKTKVCVRARYCFWMTRGEIEELCRPYIQPIKQPFNITSLGLCLQGIKVISGRTKVAAHRLKLDGHVGHKLPTLFIRTCGYDSAEMSWIELNETEQWSRKNRSAAQVEADLFAWYAGLIVHRHVKQIYKMHGHLTSHIQKIYTSHTNHTKSHNHFLIMYASLRSTSDYSIVDIYFTDKSFGPRVGMVSFDFRKISFGICSNRKSLTYHTIIPYHVPISIFAETSQHFPPLD